VNAGSWIQPPAARPAIDADRVHVWRLPLRPPAAVLASVRRNLSPAELERARGIRSPRDREAFVAGRGLQREVLALYAGIEPAEVAYQRGPQGKPVLSGAAGEAGLRFNASNSGDLALVALSWGRDVGVDLERLHAMPDLVALARRFFTASESDALAAMEPPVREAAFFRCWTLKEAFVKAAGGGLSIRLDAFEVAFADPGAAALLATRDDPSEAARWTLVSLDPGSGYAGALAVEGDGWSLGCFDWHPPA
jgi:4'-phosphopantetheinyl transferase